MKLKGLKEITVLGMKHTITYFESNCRTDDNMGRSDTKMGQITLCKGMPQDIEEQTLLHEIIHVIDGNLSTNMSEKQVTAISAGLYAVIKENKL